MLGNLRVLGVQLASAFNGRTRRSRISLHARFGSRLDERSDGVTSRHLGGGGIFGLSGIEGSRGLIVVHCRLKPALLEKLAAGEVEFRSASPVFGAHGSCALCRERGCRRSITGDARFRLFL